MREELLGRCAPRCPACPAHCKEFSKDGSGAPVGRAARPHSSLFSWKCRRSTTHMYTVYIALSSLLRALRKAFFQDRALQLVNQSLT